MNDGVNRYRSIDAKGRVWGAPSAFGGGQCQDCPAKAKSNCRRCLDCQRKLAEKVYPAIAPTELQVLTNAVGKLMELQREPEKRPRVTAEGASTARGNSPRRCTPL